MIDIMSYYLFVLILFQPIEEIHNCNNPNLIGLVPHYVCVWDEDDFYTNINGQKYYDQNEKDNRIKAYYRAKY